MLVNILFSFDYLNKGLFTGIFILNSTCVHIYFSPEFINIFYFRFLYLQEYLCAIVFYICAIY